MLLVRGFILRYACLLLQLSLTQIIAVKTTVGSGQWYIVSKHLVKVKTPENISVTELHGISQLNTCTLRCDTFNGKCISGIYDSDRSSCQLYNDTAEVTFGAAGNLMYFEKRKSVAEDCKYIEEKNTEVFNYDVIKISTSLEICQDACCINQSCAAVSYNRSTSHCAMSEKPSIMSYPGDDERTTFVKEQHLADLKVFEFSKLLARGRKVKMSSQFGKHAGANAVDGIYVPEEDGQSLANTDKESSPWLQVDLLINYYIFGVKIWNRTIRTEALRKRLANVRVTIGEKDEYLDDPPKAEICNFLPGRPPVDPYMMNCHNRMLGRYVRLTGVQMNDSLNLYEVEVHGWIQQ